MIQVMTSMNMKCPNCLVLQASTPILLIHYKPQILYVFGFLYLRRLSLYSKRLDDQVVYILVEIGRRIQEIANNINRK